MSDRKKANDDRADKGMYGNDMSGSHKDLSRESRGCFSGGGNDGAMGG